MPTRTSSKGAGLIFLPMTISRDWGTVGGRTGSVVWLVTIKSYSNGSRLVSYRFMPHVFALGSVERKLSWSG
jgi:hypothetical protein